jgi:DNA-binding PadR family transcriptional regulator
MKLERELMRGAAPTAVMQVLASGEKYGYELVETLSRQSNGLSCMLPWNSCVLPGRWLNK